MSRRLLAGLVLAFALTDGTVGAAGGEVAAGTILDGRDEAGRPRTFRVEAVAPDPEDHSGDLVLYTFSVRGVGGQFVPYCEPDRTGSRQAVVIGGRFDGRGRLHPGPQITISCLGGVAAKCVRWGYAPWRLVDGKPMLPYYQACLRMARADYCGDGVTHTRDGTFIDLWDRLGIQKREVVTDRAVVFEAGWGPDGATFVNVQRWSDDARALVASCPRLRRRIARTPAERLSSEELLARHPETLLFNDRASDRAEAQRPISPAPPAAAATR